jgi:putative toxin-antitoxin system antitoxin component (TIGR02293 family)
MSDSYDADRDALEHTTVDVVGRVAEVLGGSDVLRKPVRTWMDLDRVVRAGLPKRSLQLVARHVVEPGESANELVYSVVPSATFKRRSKLSLEESQRTERLARVIALTETLWDHQDHARAFLNRAHPLLDGETPLNAARTELGARRVEQLVHEIEHGLPL